ncbi:MAG: ABC transporter ATP-binding protein [Alphaproteobacteria bacterium]|nr:ABC transporter ATP-binding protein [Alphaproteobacteria bacterium]
MVSGISARGVSVAISGTPLIEDISLTVNAGEMVALIGPNGAGKSTLLKALCGIVASSGSIEGAGSDAAYMPQESGVATSLTVMEAMLLGRVRTLGIRVSRNVLNAASSALSGFGLAELAGRRLDTLSGGQRQLVFLAQSVFREPNALLLDEPTSALDLRHQLMVLESVRTVCRARRMAVVVALHDLGQAARFADRIVCMSDGRIVADGAPDRVLTEDRIRAVYRVEVEICRTVRGALSITPMTAA